VDVHRDEEQGILAGKIDLALPLRPPDHCPGSTGQVLRILMLNESALMSTDDPVGTAVVGFGFAGRCFHSYLVGLAPGLNLQGVVSSRAEARQQITDRLQTRAYEHFDELLADTRVELVVLATPNDLHAPQAIAALEAGKHVVTDKPMCLDLAQADAMIDAANQAGRVLSVFQNRRWDSDYLTVKRLLQEQTLGKLVYAQLAWGQFGAPGSWRGEAERGGGKFVDLGAHMIDQALQLASSPLQRVYARFSDAGLPNDVEDHAHCILSFADGSDVHIVTSSLARLQMPRWYVLGTEGALEKHGVDPQERFMIAGNIDAATEDESLWPRVSRAVAGQTTQMVVQPVAGRWRSYYENVGAAIRGRAELAVTAQSVRQVMAVLDASRTSVRTGQSVEMAQTDD
jgi:scyllo-inositol 2-dehydrogenase (NADP+)